MEKSGVSPQAISLPQGGGALRGLGETFQADVFTGTGRFSIPISTSPGRSGVGPQLQLQYGTGAGNGPFGLGWQLSIPRISRKTEKGLPRYDDGDTFLLSGAEDLVPALRPGPGGLEPDLVRYGAFQVTRFRPRTEGGFARIERWVDTRDAARGVHWRVTTRENVTSVFGRTADARLADPVAPERVFAWLLQETLDARGNHILYEYVLEDPANVPAGIAEQRRSYAQRYLRRILYGNSDAGTPPRRTGTDHADPLGLRERSYHFEVLLDYGRREGGGPPADPYPGHAPEVATTGWAIRPDPFSTGRPGFELRTLRRCERVLMVHHFPAELGEPLLVRSTDFTYEPDPDSGVSLLTEVRVRGHRRSNGVYRADSLPAVRLRYSRFEPDRRRYCALGAEGDALPDRSLADPNVTLVDLTGDGLPDVLETTPAGFRYWRNLGDGRLDRPRVMESAPAGIALGQPGVGFGDLNGNGQPDLLVHAGPLRGFFELSPEVAWRPFRPYQTFPDVAADDPNTRFLDLTGNGLPDILTTAEHDFLWMECLGAEGYAPARAVVRLRDADEFPDVFFAAPEERIRLADMNGDGLLDIVQVHDGRIEYWPSLGYGRFGRRVVMADAPAIGHAFDPRRLLLADLDGDGCADLAYVESGQVTVWLNRSGNGWSPGRTIHGTPPVSNLDAVQVADVFGTSTAALIWSYDRHQQPDGNYKVLDLAGGTKPYLLVEMASDMGTTTRVTYGSATGHRRVADQAGQPWATRLPVPVQVVDRVETIDHVAGTRLTTTYAYHHGHWDGREREFRGFARVDQQDAEATAAPAGAVGGPLPPTLTRTWFHTGACPGETELTAVLAREFYAGDPRAFPPGRHEVETGDTPFEAYRALRGSVIRAEVYGLDGTARAAHPYSVTETTYGVRQLQPADRGRRPVHLTRSLTAVTCDYERRPDDPRVSQVLALAHDRFGTVTDSVSWGYPRRGPAVPEQAAGVGIHTHLDVVNQVDGGADRPPPYYVGAGCQSRAFEVTGVDWRWPLDPAVPAQPLRRADFLPLLVGDLPIQPFEWERPATHLGMARRLISWTRTYFRRDARADVVDPPGDLTHRLPLGEIARLGLPYESYQAALTTSLLTARFGDRVTPDRLRAGGYHQEPDVPDTWWIPSGRQGFRADRGYLPGVVQDPFGSRLVLEHDAYGLLLERSVDPLGNETRATNDYRVLQPSLVRDPNGNRSATAFDRLGMVVGLAAMGKAGEPVGDSLDGFEPDPDPVRRAGLFDGADPAGVAAGLLGSATARWVYDVERYARTRRAGPGGDETGEPTAVAVLRRETHVSDLAPGQSSAVQLGFTYYDGSGRPIQAKAPVAPGPAPVRDPASGALRLAGGRVELAHVDRRFVGTGGVVYDGKGRPVRQYEPFFSSTHRFEPEAELHRWGVASTRFYDPPGRPVLTLRPDHAYDKVVFDAWQEAHWDANDTVVQPGQPPDRQDPRVDADVGHLLATVDPGEVLPTWYGSRIGRPAGDPERDAAVKAAAHAATPELTHRDVLGRAFLTVAMAGPGASLATRLSLDVQGRTVTVRDPRDIAVFRHDYDLAGRRLGRHSADGGLRATLPDVAGSLLAVWGPRGHLVEAVYDALRRPVELWVTEPGGARGLAELRRYGEALADPAATNHRGRILLTFDGAGLARVERYDFRGTPRETTRRLPLADAAPPRWTDLERESGLAALLAAATGRLAGEALRTGTAVDALGRVVARRGPDGSAWHYRYDAGGRRVGIDLRPADETAPRVFLQSATYNARGQRERVVLGNGVAREYTYDDRTLRLGRLRSTRADGSVLQDLTYTHDPVGNVTRRTDGAVAAVFFRNQRVDGEADYTYDALYRLTRATGREHVAMTPGHYRRGEAKQTEWLPLQPLSNARALRGYVQEYDLDPAGNLLRTRHVAGGGGWTRELHYAPDSNRLARAEPLLGDPAFDFPHDPAGNLTAFPHLPALTWDFADHLVAVDRGAVAGSAHYAYDEAGQRVRTVRVAGAEREERISLGDWEVYRRTRNGVLALERVTHHLLDGTRRIALVETRTDGGAPRDRRVRYQVDDHLGSSVAEVDETPGAALISLEEYYPYGCTAYLAGASEVEVRAKRYRYAGRERDDETGLYYYGARYQAPWLGRFLSCDPAEGGLNRYAFTLDNPVRLGDPDGRGAGDPFAGLGQSISPEFAAEFHVDLTGRQVPGFVKESIEPVIHNGRYTLRTRFTGPGGYGHYFTQFDIESRTFLGTGNTGTRIVTTGDLHGIGLSTSVREEGFQRFTAEFSRPRAFEIPVEHPGSRAVLQTHLAGDLVETPISRAVFQGTFIGQHTAEAGEAVLVRIAPRVTLMSVGGGQTVFAAGTYRLALGLLARRLAGWALGPAGMAAGVGMTLHEQSPAGRKAAAQEDAEASNAQSNLLNARLAGFLEPGHFDAWLAKELGCRDCWSDARTMAGVVGWKNVYLQEVEMQREQGFDVAVDREKMMSSVVYHPENAESFLNQLYARNPRPTSIGAMR